METQQQQQQQQQHLWPNDFGSCCVCLHVAYNNEFRFITLLLLRTFVDE